MICHDFLRAIDAYLDDELSVMQALQMNGHLRFCEPCRKVMESESKLHALLSDAETRDEPAPSSLRERILQKVISEETNVLGGQSRPRSLGWGWLVGVAMAGLALLVALIPGSQRPAVLIPLAAEVAAKHLLYSYGGGPASDLSVSEPSQLAQWLERRVGFPVSLPRLGADQRLVGGRVSSVADAPAAYLLYEWRGHRISLFVTRPVPAGRGASERMVAGVDVHASVLEGIYLMWWADEKDGPLYVVASSSGESELQEFARLCIQSDRAEPPSAPHSRTLAPNQRAAIVDNGQHLL